MPHAGKDGGGKLPDEEQDAADDLLIQQALDPQGGYNIFDRELEPGEKADDAVDYEDISDNDLADDDEEEQRRLDEIGTGAQQGQSVGDDLFDLGDLGNDHSFQDLESAGFGNDNLDDLFGDTPSSPTAVAKSNVALETSALFEFDGDEIFGEPIGPIQDGELTSLGTTSAGLPLSGLPESSGTAESKFTTRAEADEMELLQRQLFAMSNYPPAPPENQEQLLESLWPRFQADKVPRFFDLMPMKKARYLGKTPLKTPKPVQPTKVSLELAADQEKAFKFTSGTAKRTIEAVEESGLVSTESRQAQQERDADQDMEEDSDYENEPIGGVSWHDFQVLCEDWSIADGEEDSQEPETPPLTDDLFDAESLNSAAEVTKSKTGSKSNRSILDAPQFPLLSIHDFDTSIKKVAKAVTLDLNDPHLLFDRTQPAVDKLQKDVRQNKTQSGEISKRLARRYNISNDSAYDLLKENHQSKIRSHLGQPVLVHSGPARRLQYPYYKTKLSRHDARNWHRPTAEFRKNEPITFQAIDIRGQKRKHMKLRDQKTLFNKTEDLSLRDNAYTLLLEYSEEHPAVLSNFGMVSRLTNFYRKTTPDDPERPKKDLGELNVLLPQDKSPFWQFGHVDSGTTVACIQNALYKAPIFEHDPKKTDFLMTRTGTIKSGRHWYLKNIENLRVVGQQFPSQEVPRPNGRKVSTAAKNRIKMVAYRLMRRKKDGRILIPEVTRHTAGDTDMQLRQKLKEFLQYNKDNKDWGMIGDRPIPDEEATRAALPPEDACLVESVQVGQQHLEDAGYAKQGDAELDDDAEEKEGQSVEEQLAPWHTTKNFLMATAGKAMLQLHGEGDPSGRGEAFSLLKTSMKGGFKAIGESVEDKISAKKRKELGGHSYNVAEQNKAYEQSIRRIWDAQYQSLSTNVEHSDVEMDIDDPEERADSMPLGMTPRSEMPTPSATGRRRDDETMSEFSRFSTNSQRARVLKIMRKIRNDRGVLEDREELVRDPRVIRQYMKRKQLREMERIDFKRIKSSDVENNPMVRKQLESELNRLERNKDRRLTREKQKAGAAGSPGSPNSPAGATKPVGTQRKCANCGQIGHIKTNKKLCPLLNGTMKQEDGFGDSSFSMTTPGM